VKTYREFESHPFRQIITMKELILFPTEIGIFDVPDADEMNEEIIRTFIGVEDRMTVNSPGTKRLGYDLWKDTNRINKPAFHKLKKIFEQNCKIYGRRFYNNDDIQTDLGWINLNSEGAVPIPFHHHYNGVFHVMVGVYYADAVPEYGGNYIKIVDPRFAAASHFKRGEEHKIEKYILEIPVQTSQMIFMPEYLFHAVDFSKSPKNKPRVSVATNFIYQPT
jgi:hypothetical protein